MCGGHLSADSFYIVCLGYETGSHTGWPVGRPACEPGDLPLSTNPSTGVLSTHYTCPTFICELWDLNSDSGAC